MVGLVDQYDVTATKLGHAKGCSAQTRVTIVTIVGESKAAHDGYRFSQNDMSLSNRCHHCNEVMGLAGLDLANFGSRGERVNH